MGTVIWITCEDSSLSTPYDVRCAPLEIANPQQVSADAITAALTAAGWSTDADGHHCPTHNPALRGFPIRLEGGTIIEPIPGLRLRLAPEEVRNVVRAEILLDRERFDVEGDTHSWRAKPVGGEWPT